MLKNNNKGSNGGIREVSLHHTEINLKEIRNLNVRVKTIKNTEEIYQQIFMTLS